MGAILLPSKVLHETNSNVIVRLEGKYLEMQSYQVLFKNALVKFEVEQVHKI